MTYTYNTCIISTVLVPDSNEDSVDIYDGLDFNPSSNAGNGLFKMFSLWSTTAQYYFYYYLSAWKRVQHRSFCFDLLQKSPLQMLLSWKSQWIFMKKLSQRNSIAEIQHTLRWVNMCSMFPFSLLTCYNGPFIQKVRLEINLFFTVGLCWPYTRG